jgi:osmotically inducible protein OsmC
MTIRKAQAVWTGTLKEGSGNFSVGSGTIEGPYTWASRFADDVTKTNPEELVGAAHAACYAMFLSGQLTGAGFTPTRIQANSEIDFGRDDSGPVFVGITLNVEAQVPGVSEEQFAELAEKSKKNCPISRALASVPITLNARLVG